jgi:methyl-accepting chemotaxis protein
VTDTGRASWVHTPAGVIIVNGVIAAIVGAGTAWVLNNASSIPWDRVLWIGLAVAGAAFIGLSLLVKQLREMIWRRPAVWIWSQRPVTARRHARDLAAADEARRALAVRADKALDQIRTSLQGVTLQLATQLGDSKQRVDSVAKAVEDLDKQLKAINDGFAALAIDQK